MRNLSNFHEWKRIVRYYVAGLANTIFGFGIFSCFIYIGFNLFISQLFAHAIGTAFNFLTYGKFAFKSDAKIINFIISYVLNYAIGFASLYAVSLYISSPYLAGLISTIFVSILNYFVLKNFVYGLGRS